MLSDVFVFSFFVLVIHIPVTALLAWSFWAWFKRGTRNGVILATGIVLGIIRACCLALGSHFLTTTADYRQAIGYFMAMLSLPELTLVSSLRGDYEIWIVSGGLSVVAGSALWALILAGGLNLYDAVRSPARSDNS